jgi:16S rRNA (guanine(966)-N(2))-methyltransferase RsmD
MKNRYLLRVISGKYRGKGIISPEDMKVRPTSQRVKESLFNILRTSLYDSDFLDIFSGTGQVGIEAISNGARCTFVDKDVSIIRKNISAVGCEDTSLVISGDFKTVLSNLRSRNVKFDYVFADPPYNDGLYEDIIIMSLPLLKDDGRIILEHSSEYSVSVPSCCEIIDVRRYGSRALTFLGGQNE